MLDSQAGSDPIILGTTHPMFCAVKATILEHILASFGGSLGRFRAQEGAALGVVGPSFWEVPEAQLLNRSSPTTIAKLPY